MRTRRVNFSVPIRELFGCFGRTTFDTNVFALFTGYIDDSGSSATNLVTLACVAGWGARLETLEQMWSECLAKKNEQLRLEGRKEITHYHATDCSNYVNEFEGWSKDEQIAFTKELLRILEMHRLVIASYTLDTKDLLAVFPEAENKEFELANAILLRKIMNYLSDKILGNPDWPDWKNDVLALIHEEGSYDAVLLDSFKSVKNSENFPRRDRFVTLAPMTKACVLLQAADFVAYENFRAAQRELVGCPRRISFKVITESDSISGQGVKILEQGLIDFRNALTEDGLRTLFKDARILRD